MKPTTENKVIIERITQFVSDIYGDKDKAKIFMKTNRREFKGKNAIEMIKADQLNVVMLYIHARFF